MAASVSLGVFKFFILCTILPQLRVEGKQNLVSLNEENWDAMLEGEWMVEFFAPWCPACKALQPVWHEFSDWSTDLGIKVGQVDVTTSPGLSGRFMVTALPTIFHVLKGEFRQYKGSRDKEALISFIEDKRWKSIDPVPSWKSPGSIQMSIVSYFFKLSTVLRTVHNQLLEEYGLPTWGSYLIFAVATIFIGAFLGLLLVCVIDCIYPPKSSLDRSSTLASLKEENEEDEGDDIIDEGAETGGDSQSETQSEGEISQDEAKRSSPNSPKASKDKSDNSQESEEKNASGGSGGESSPNVRKRRARKAD